MLDPTVLPAIAEVCKNDPALLTPYQIGFLRALRFHLTPEQEAKFKDVLSLEAPEATDPETVLGNEEEETPTPEAEPKPKKGRPAKVKEATEE